MGWLPKPTLLCEHWTRLANIEDRPNYETKNGCRGFSLEPRVPAAFVGGQQPSTYGGWCRSKP